MKMQQDELQKMRQLLSKVLLSLFQTQLQTDLIRKQLRIMFLVFDIKIQLQKFEIQHEEHNQTPTDSLLTKLFDKGMYYLHLNNLEL